MSFVLRLRGRTGQFRVVYDPSSDKAFDVVARVAKTLHVPSTALALFHDEQCSQPLNVPTDPNAPASAFNLRSGDILYFVVNDNDEVSNKQVASVTQTTPTTSSDAIVAAAARRIPESSLDAVDRVLTRDPGLIPRTRDPNFCRHGAAGMCQYCTPLDPWDDAYLERNKIKHLSFHSFLRKQMRAQRTLPIDSPGFVPPLEPCDIAIRVPCPSNAHEPFPRGVCTKCQPSAVTLQSQRFRMVDHLEFEAATIVDNIVASWRATGTQRFAYLIGTYQPYPDVPLGCKALVTAAYEPCQIGSFDGLHAELADPGILAAQAVAANAGGQQIVGMIYTDLNDAGRGDGSVICKRHLKSYFLSSAEVIFAGQEQLLRRTKTRYSPTGLFGSRFVTCVISGNTKGEIDLAAYQVSNMGMEMIRVGLVDATVEPSLLRVDNGKVTPGQQQKQQQGDIDGPPPHAAFHVPNNIVELTTGKVDNTDIPRTFRPEVSYKFKNKYNLNVQETANPTFPVDYLIVTLTHGFPQVEPPRTFISGFPIENRGEITNNAAAILSAEDNGGGSAIVPSQTTFKGADFDQFSARYILNAVEKSIESSNGNDLGDDFSRLDTKQLARLNDFHLLVYLLRTEIVPTDEFLRFVGAVYQAHVALQRTTNAEGKASAVSDNATAQLDKGNVLQGTGSGSGSRTPTSGITGDLIMQGENLLTSDGYLDMESFPGVRSLLQMAKMMAPGGGNAQKQQQQQHGGSYRSPDRSGALPVSSSVAMEVDWECRHCTFVNEGSGRDCAMCGLPKDQ